MKVGDKVRVREGIEWHPMNYFDSPEGEIGIIVEICIDSEGNRVYELEFGGDPNKHFGHENNFTKEELEEIQ